MIKYFLTRIKQPSTWLGILGVVGTVVINGGVVTPEAVVSIMTSLGLVHINEQN